MTVPKKTVFVFLHVPKTAGTTWRSILYRQFPDGAVCPVYDEDGYFYSRKEFAALTLAARGKFEAVIGHFGVGISRQLAPDVESRLGAFLREPVARCVSLAGHLASRRGKGAQTPVTALLGERDLQFDNHQVRWLSGIAAPFGGVSGDMLEAATVKLGELAFIGLTDRFNESYALASACLGWKILPFARLNVTARVRAEISISKSERGQIDELNQFDRLLYQRASALFEKRIEAQLGVDPAGWRKKLVTVEAASHAKVSASSRGAIGRFEAGRVRGWARLVQHDEPAVVEAVLAGRVIAQAVAKDPRPGLAKKGFEPAGRCGFELRLPQAVAGAGVAGIEMRVAQTGERLAKHSALGSR